MKKILNCEMEEFLCRLRTIKEFYDDGSRKILQQFSDYEEDWEAYETNAYEDLWSLSEIEDMHELYYNEDEPIGEDEYREAYGESILCRTEDMQRIDSPYASRYSSSPIGSSSL